MRKKSFLLCVVFFLFSFFIIDKLGYALDLSLFVSERDLFIKATQNVYTYNDNPLYVGGKFFYSNKDNNKVYLENLWIGVKDISQVPVNLGLGFQEIGGKIKFENQGNQTEENFDVFSLGFKFMASLHHSVINNYIRIPVELSTNVVYSPSILNFSDAERVISFNFAVYYYLTSSAAVGVSYQYYKIYLENSTTSYTDWENSIVMLGIKISF